MALPDDPNIVVDPQAIAEGRFTHTPIAINSPSNVYRQQGMGILDENDPNASEGQYNFKTGQASINLAPNATHQDVSQISNHEQIHALLSPHGEQAPITFDNIKPYLNWASSGRVGHPGAEIPAYMGSYLEGQIKNIQPSDAKAFQEKLLAKLPADKAKVYRQIIKAQEANKEFYK